jgi:hypothetical protein
MLSWLALVLAAGLAPASEEGCPAWEPTEEDKEVRLEIGPHDLWSIPPGNKLFWVELRLFNETDRPVFLEPMLGQDCGLLIAGRVLPDGEEQQLYLQMAILRPGDTRDWRDFFELHPGRSLDRHITLPLPPEFAGPGRVDVELTRRSTGGRASPHRRPRT